jgi:hypothetical protein
MRDQEEADLEGQDEHVIKTGTRPAAARRARRLAGAAGLAAVVALALLPSPASAATHHWSAPVTVDYPNALSAVSCPDATFCMAVGNQPGNQGYAASWDGSAWSALAAVDLDGILLSVSCASASFCAAADNHGYFLTWNGTSWSAPVLVDNDTTPGPAVYSLSCPSARFCMAVDDIGQALVFNGATWSLDTTPIFPGNYASPTQVSCASAAFCMAVSEAGYAVSWGGRVFSAPVNVVGPAYNFTSVSCPANGSCVALSGNAVGYYSGGTWTATEGVDYGSYLSCPNTNLCISVSRAARAWTYRRGAWSGPVVPGSSAVVPVDVSCPAWNFCMAVDGDGLAVRYT